MAEIEAAHGVHVVGPVAGNVQCKVRLDKPSVQAIGIGCIRELQA